MKRKTLAKRQAELKKRMLAQRKTDARNRAILARYEAEYRRERRSMAYVRSFIGRPKNPRKPPLYDKPEWNSQAALEQRFLDKILRDDIPLVK